MKVINISVVILVLFLTGVWIHESCAAIDAESVMGVWLFDSGKGAEVKDSSGKGNDGKIVGAKRVEGKIGMGVEFDGSNQVVIPASATIDDYRDGFTYLLWVKPLGVPGGPHIRLIERDWHNPNILIGPNDFYGSFVFNGGIDNSQIRSGTWELEEWSFVALTHDGKTLILYVDGEEVADINVGQPDLTKNRESGSIWLARWKGEAGWDFSGVLDEVAIFNTALDVDDINDIMTKGLEDALAVSPLGRLTTTWGNIKTGKVRQ
ncbi:MAG: LamG domain-containing protein [Candidatus Poribacteria bacterium]|nr:LamG domain-containing protein [Candidatus Poribacteria bacterium]